MNIKAERIEQLIQIVNRNLHLIYSGAQDSVTPLELRKLQKVDTQIFGHDKFAFEMIHFVKSSDETVNNGSKHMAAIWEKNFIRGLENLLVECAVVVDDIERDCFVSRIYCWFTEKLAERRDLPRAVTAFGGAQFNNLKDALKSMGNPAHTLKGLELLNEPVNNVNHSTEQDDEDNWTVQNQPVIAVPDSPSKYGSRNIPVYVKHGFPDVLKPKIDYTSFLPKISGAEENYGMMHHKPETEVEIKMHELWLARRRQEAFEWKTQQHLKLVMDRLALHKSRLESDSLRRQESNALLVDTKEARQRPHSADDMTRKFAPLSRRPTSSSRKLNKKSLSTGILLGDNSPDHSPEREIERSITPEAGIDVVPIVMKNDMEGTIEEAAILKASRTPVAKKIEHLPMVFKHSLPSKYGKSMLEKNEYYMQLSDSDDDDKPDRPSGGRPGTNKAKGKAASSAVAVMFKRDKPIVRERPVSARMFRSVAINDPEFKVMYRHTNYRRMPLTPAQEHWLEDKETERAKKSEEMASKLLAAAAEKNAKGGKGDKKDAKKDDKKDDKKKDKKKEPEKPIEAEKPKSKWKSASHFMTVNFPTFDGDDNNVDSHGPMRTMQLIECARVMSSCYDYEIKVSEQAIRKALVIPQDKPEAMCLESFRTNQTEGLMTNPIPEEFWRKVHFGGSGKKKKGKKK